MEIQVNIDCADLERMTTFYEAALGYVRHGTAGDQYASMVAADGIGPKLVFQKVPEAKAVKNRVHLDLIVENIEAEAIRFVSLGATRGRGIRRVRDALDRDARSRRQRGLPVRRLVLVLDVTRAFVAICPPPPVLDAVEARTAAVDIPGARRTPREQWHITVQFLGNDGRHRRGGRGAGAGSPRRPRWSSSSARAPSAEPAIAARSSRWEHARWTG